MRKEILIPFLVALSMLSGCNPQVPTDGEIAKQQEKIKQLKDLNESMKGDALSAPIRVKLEEQIQNEVAYLADLKEKREKYDESANIATALFNYALPGSGVIFAGLYGFVMRKKKNLATEALKATVDAIAAVEDHPELKEQLKKNHVAAGVYEFVKPMVIQAKIRNGNHD